MPLSQSLPVQSQGIDKAALRDAAEAFEAHFLRQMIGSMRSASLGEDLLGSNAGDQFRDLADDRIAESMAEQQSFGIAELLLQQFGVDDTRDTPFGEQK
ncbi:MAG: rod-binding protein [Pseudomonadota bacterium]